MCRSELWFSRNGFGHSCRAGSPGPNVRGAGEVSARTARCVVPLHQMRFAAAWSSPWGHTRDLLAHCGEMFTAGSLTSGCLDVMLESLATGKTHSIAVSPGSRGLTDWRTLCTVYGDTLCELHDSKGQLQLTLRELRPIIRSASTHLQLQVISVVCSATKQLGHAEDGLFDLRLISRDGAAFAALIRHGCSQDRLLAMKHCSEPEGRVYAPRGWTKPLRIASGVGRPSAAMKQVNHSA